MPSRAALYTFTLFLLVVPVLITGVAIHAGLFRGWRWGPYWGIDDGGAWLGFWGTAFSLSIALWIFIFEAHRHGRDRVLEVENRRQAKEEVLLDSASTSLDALIAAYYGRLMRGPAREDFQKEDSELRKKYDELIRDMYKWVPYSGVEENLAKCSVWISCERPESWLVPFIKKAVVQMSMQTAHRGVR